MPVVVEFGRDRDETIYVVGILEEKVLDGFGWDRGDLIDVGIGSCSCLTLLIFYACSP